MDGLTWAASAKRAARNRKNAMKRYFVRPAKPPRLLARTVYEPDADPIESGILDAEGRMIVYQYRIGPIGFITNLEDE
jgi:hypothetical protein